MLLLNPKTIIRNIKAIRASLPPQTRFCAVVKSNAYGLGDVLIAKIISPYVDMFAVSRIAEAVRLRNSGNDKPILLFGVCDDLQTAIRNDLTITVGSVPEMQSAIDAAAGAKLSIHIKVNTGMNRFGITNPWHLRTIIKMAHANKNVVVGGLYTHLSHETTTAENIEIIDRQLKRFTPFRAMFTRAFPAGIVHAACSGAATYPPAVFDMIRIGKAIYGAHNDTKIKTKTAVYLTGKVVNVRQIQKNENVGYGWKIGGGFVAKDNMTVGIVNIGYVDGMLLLFARPDYVLVGNTKCPIIGAVCMDNFMIDVSAAENPLGKTVTVIGKQNGVRLIDHINHTGQSGAKILTSLRTNLSSIST
jgi:alanine racemase